MLPVTREDLPSNNLLFLTLHPVLITTQNLSTLPPLMKQKWMWEMSFLIGKHDNITFSEPRQIGVIQKLNLTLSLTQ